MEDRHRWRSMAKEESEVWESLSKEEKNGRDMPTYWNERDGRASYGVIIRRTLHLANNDELWAELEVGLSPRVAADLAIKLRRMPGVSFEVMYREYKTGRTRVDEPSGFYYRKPAKGKVPLEKNVWDGVRKSVRRAAQSFFVGEDSARAEPLIDEFMVQVQVMASNFRDRLSRQAAVLPSRQKLRDACLFLSCDVPRVGKPVDLKRAEKNARMLQGLRHPDRMKDNYDHESYLEVGRELEIVRSYNEALTAQEKADG